MINLQLTVREAVTIFLSLTHSSLDDMHGADFKQRCEKLANIIEEKLHNASK